MRAISSAAYVTAVLRLLEAYNRGDFEAAGELQTPDVEWHGLLDHHGRDAVLEYLRGLHSRQNRSHARPEDFRAEPGRVLIVVTFTGEDPHPQPVAEEHQSWVCELTDDTRIRRVITYPSPAEAVHAFEEMGRQAPA